MRWTIRGLLAAGAEERFDRLTRETRERFGISSASVALITEDRQIIKSGVGPLVGDLPRELALCAVTVQQDRTLIICDASHSPDFQDHPLVVDGPGIRFYAGHPLHTAEGWRIGALCVIDDQPRSFDEVDASALRVLAGRVQLEIWLGDPEA